MAFYLMYQILYAPQEVPYELWLVTCYTSIPSSDQPRGSFCSFLPDLLYDDFVTQGQRSAMQITEPRMLCTDLCRENEQIVWTLLS